MFMPAMILMRLTRPTPIDRGEHQDLFERAVDAEANAQTPLGRLDVDVGCPVAHRLGENAVDHLDDRRVVFENDIGGRRRRVEGPPACGLDCLEGLDEVIESTDGSIVVVDGATDLGERRQHRLDRIAAGLAEERQQFGRRLVGHGHVQTELVELHRDDEVLTGHGIGNELQRVNLGGGLPEVRHLHAVELRSSVDEVSLIDEPHVEERVPEVRRSAVDRCREGLVDLSLGHEVALEQQLLEAHAGLTVQGPGGRFRRVAVGAGHTIL